MNKLIIALYVCFLASCGGGGGSPPAGGASAATSFSGVAVDGYLYRARAFLDLNGSGQYDSGEPTAITDENGGFTLSATQDQINSHSVVVIAIAGTTIDQDYPNTPLTSGMTLVAPAGNPYVVSPLTTQVSAKMAGGLSLADAKSAVQTELGLPNIDVMKNFVAEKATNGAYADAHKVAASVAEVLKNIETQSSANTTLANRFSLLTTTVTSLVGPNVTQIKAAASLDDAKTVTTNLLSQSVNIYSIGGSISGLTSSGLVLANGVSTLSPSSGANSFTFSSRKASGATYAVTVESNPVGQICTILNSSGNVGSQSITNVSVSCTNTPGALGGTISGLTTSGLILKNGSDELTVVSGSSTFQFSSTVADGSAYSVAVKTQPTGKTCSVSNVSGTMVSAGVSNVQVVCSANSYSVSGSISGLTTSGLRLKLGDEVINISSGNTTFAFDTRVAYGARYAVVIDRQPTGYTCSASNAAGTMGASNLTSTQITCSTISYSINGSITGYRALSQSPLQLVLSNSTERLSILPGVNSFSFSNKVAYGGAYSVAIETQPLGHTCTLINGIGSNVSADVNNVQVSCVLTSYQVLGVISGLNENLNWYVDISVTNTTKNENIITRVSRNSAPVLMTVDFQDSITSTIVGHSIGIYCLQSRYSNGARYIDIDRTNIASETEYLIECKGAQSVKGVLNGINISNEPISNISDFRISLVNRTANELWTAIYSKQCNYAGNSCTLNTTPTYTKTYKQVYGLNSTRLVTEVASDTTSINFWYGDQYEIVYQISGSRNNVPIACSASVPRTGYFPISGLNFDVTCN